MAISLLSRNLSNHSQYFWQLIKVVYFIYGERAQETAQPNASFHGETCSHCRKCVRSHLLILTFSLIVKNWRSTSVMKWDLF